MRMFVDLRLATVPTGEDNGSTEGSEVANNLRKGGNPLRMLQCHVTLNGSSVLHHCRHIGQLCSNSS